MNAIKIYRVAHCLRLKGIPVIPRLLKYTMFLLYNSIIPPECDIGKGSYFGHRGIGVVLHPGAKIGARVLIGQGITVGGTMGAGPPTIGDDVWIGPGARILGDISIGNNSVIGANAVVTKSFPANSVVGGVPARLLKTIGVGQLDTSSGTLQPLQ